TITRSAGSWVTDGFVIGKTIRIEGAGANDGRYVIADVSATTLTLIEGARLTDASDVAGAKIDTLSIVAADTITRSSGDWAADGFAVGQTITV
ncbi:hypothetical protein, partial [Klebsiella pneumoniae]|uniref:hypothetical protein n=1 Tax=Klebsiella pneumoniae TaxID=573 RepID=UPI00132F6067